MICLYIMYIRKIQYFIFSKYVHKIQFFIFSKKAGHITILIALQCQYVRPSVSLKLYNLLMENTRTLNLINFKLGTLIHISVQIISIAE